MTTLAGTNARVLSNDEATAAEQAEVKEKEDKVLLRNKEFEKNKEEFCTNFITDMEDRKKKNSQTLPRSKRVRTDILRIKGNNCLFQGQEVREIFGALYGCAKGHPI